MLRKLGIHEDTEDVKMENTSAITGPEFKTISAEHFRQAKHNSNADEVKISMWKVLYGLVVLRLYNYATANDLIEKAWKEAMCKDAGFSSICLFIRFYLRQWNYTRLQIFIVNEKAVTSRELLLAAAWLLAADNTFMRCTARLADEAQKEYFLPPYYTDPFLLLREDSANDSALESVRQATLQPDLRTSIHQIVGLLHKVKQQIKLLAHEQALRARYEARFRHHGISSYTMYLLRHPEALSQHTQVVTIDDMHLPGITI